MSKASKPKGKEILSNIINNVFYDGKSLFIIQDKKNNKYLAQKINYQKKLYSSSIDSVKKVYLTKEKLQKMSKVS